MVRRRRMNVFSLSFLDVMSCGFGAVVLIFLIIKHATDVEHERSNSTTLAAVSKVNREVTIGQKDLAELRREMNEIEFLLASTEQEQSDTEAQLEATLQRLLMLQQTDTTVKEDDLRSEIERLEREVARLRSTRVSPDEEGQATRSFVGEGDRQYLTGINVGGNRILIALDASASMLAADLVNVIRFRNLPPAEQKRVPKWQRAIRTVDWITTQIPLESQFQVLVFNSEANWLLPDSRGRWMDTEGGETLNKAMQALDDVVPEGGTSLERLFRRINTLRPRPDNIFLIVDSLPTIGNRNPRRSRISGADRLELFNDAVERIPNAPVNVILFPMEGDPMAASAYWQLAMTSGGSFMSPADDWP